MQCDCYTNESMKGVFVSLRSIELGHERDSDKLRIYNISQSKYTKGL